MTAKRTILITGGTGFIGSHLGDMLSKEGYRVIALGKTDGDIRNYSTIKRFENEPINHVFHLAGKSFVPDSWANPREYYDVNVNGALTVLDFCKTTNISLSYVSSYLYGIPEQLPISEDTEPSPNNPYCHSKLVSENIASYFSKEFGFQLTIVRPFNVYGANQNQSFLIPTIIKQVLYSDEIIVQDLLPKRDYVYVKDLVRALISTIENSESPGIYNIGSGQSISVEGVIKVVQRVLGMNKKVHSMNKERKNEISDVIADISKARKILGWEPSFSFKDGIEEMLKENINPD